MMVKCKETFMPRVNGKLQRTTNGLWYVILDCPFWHHYRAGFMNAVEARQFAEAFAIAMGRKVAWVV